jgi:hypothetical protein
VLTGVPFPRQPCSEGSKTIILEEFDVEIQGKDMLMILQQKF